MSTVPINVTFVCASADAAPADKAIPNTAIDIAFVFIASPEVVVRKKSAPCNLLSEIASM
jgi:hypothetical protein